MRTNPRRQQLELCRSRHARLLEGRFAADALSMRLGINDLPPRLLGLTRPEEAWNLHEEQNGQCDRCNQALAQQNLVVSRQVDRVADISDQDRPRWP